jgi:hypothetical protein
MISLSIDRDRRIEPMRRRHPWLYPLKSQEGGYLLHSAPCADEIIDTRRVVQRTENSLELGISGPNPLGPAVMPQF